MAIGRRQIREREQLPLRLPGYSRQFSIEYWQRAAGLFPQRRANSTMSEKTMPGKRITPVQLLRRQVQAEIQQSQVYSRSILILWCTKLQFAKGYASLKPSLA